MNNILNLLFKVNDNVKFYKLNYSIPINNSTLNNKDLNHINRINKNLDKLNNIYINEYKKFKYKIFKSISKINSNLKFDNILIPDISSLKLLYFILSSLSDDLKTFLNDIKIKNIKNRLKNYNINFIFFDSISENSKNIFNKLEIETLTNIIQIVPKIYSNYNLKINVYFLFIKKIKLLHFCFNFPDFSNIFNPMYVNNILFLNIKHTKTNDNLFTYQFFQYFNNKIKEITFNFKTAGLSGKLWFRNLFFNLEYISQNYDNKLIFPLNLFKLHFNNIFNNINLDKINKIFLIGASPSLENDIEILKNELFKNEMLNYNILNEKKLKNKILDDEELKEDKLKDNKKNRNQTEKSYLIFCMDNALSFLEKNNIVPDFIIVLDSRSFIKLFIPKTFYKIPLICPLNIHHKLFKSFNTIFYFNTGFFIKKYRQIFLNTANFDYPITNIGSFSLMLLNYLNLGKIIPIGIDYEFKDRKYYHKEAFLYRYYISNQNFLKTVITESIFKTVTKNEKHLFDKYKSEFYSILDNINSNYTLTNINKNNKNKNYSNFINQNKINNPVLEENFFPLMAYYYLKTNSHTKAAKKMNAFIEKFL